MGTGKTFEPGNNTKWNLTLTTLVTILVLYTTISRLLNWDISLGSRNDKITLLLAHLGLSQVEFHLEIFNLNSLITLFTIFCTTLLLLKQLEYIRTRAFWLASLPLLALLAITGLSSCWSVAPGFTYSRFSLLLAGALGGVLIGLVFQPRELKIILEVFAAVLVIGSSLMIILKPEYGVTYDLSNGVTSSRWFGLFSWKMPAGMMMGFSSVIFFFKLLEFKQQKWAGRIYGMVFLILSLIMTYKSLSMTEVLAVAAVLFVVLLGALFLKWGDHLKPVHWWILGALAIILLLVIWFERSFFFGFIGKGESLTGRLPLWTSLVPVIKERLLFGYGFGEAFWKDSAYYQPIWDQFPYFLPVFAHNGFIEALMDTGVIGLVLWLVFLFQVAFLTLRYFFRERTLSSLFFFSWVVFIVVMNVANNHLGSYETFTWLMLVISFASMVRDIINRGTTLTDSQPA